MSRKAKAAVAVPIIGIWTSPLAALGPEALYQAWFISSWLLLFAVALIVS